MRKTVIVTLLILAIPIGFYGLVYSKFDKCIELTNRSLSERVYKNGINSIDNLRAKWWYWIITKNRYFDPLEINRQLNYQKAMLFTEIGELGSAYNLLEEVSTVKNPLNNKLTADALYNQGNLALFQGRIETAKDKWQKALERYPGGYDFDSQRNLELLQGKRRQSMAISKAGILSHRRGSSPFVPPGMKEKGGKIKP